MYTQIWSHGITTTSSAPWSPVRKFLPINDKRLKRITKKISGMNKIYTAVCFYFQIHWRSSTKHVNNQLSVQNISVQDVGIAPNGMAYHTYDETIPQIFKNNHYINYIVDLLQYIICHAAISDFHNSTTTQNVNQLQSQTWYMTRLIRSLTANVGIYILRGLRNSLVDSYLRVCPKRHGTTQPGAHECRITPRWWV